MTRDELARELSVLAAFAKIVLLDRRAAHAATADWLEATAGDESLLRWTSRTDAYGAIAAMPRAVGRRQAAVNDCLAHPLLHQMETRERAWRFLVGPAGFSDEVADGIVAKIPPATQSAADSPSMTTFASAHNLSLGPQPDLRSLRPAG